MATDDRTYKSAEDPQRAYFLLSFLNIAREFPQTSALAASFGQELHAMNLRQAERDAEAAKAAIVEVQPNKEETSHVTPTRRRA